MRSGLAISVRLGVRIGSSKAEQGPLILPGQWQTRVRQELVCGQVGWLVPVENGLRDVRSEVAEADQPREVGWTDTFLLGQCGKRRPAAARKCGVEAVRPRTIVIAFDISEQFAPRDRDPGIRGGGPARFSEFRRSSPSAHCPSNSP